VTRWQAAAVLGNGPSGAALRPGRLRTDDAIVRVNSFFAEPRLRAGPRVDLAFLGGDPRAAPFVACGIARSRAHDLRAWASDDPRAARAATRHLAAPQLVLPPLPPSLAADLRALVAAAGLRPTSGTRAVLAAVALGARDVVIAGIDLYAGTTRYAFTPGPRMAALMDADYAAAAPSPAQHAPDLDRRILARVATEPGLTLRLAAPSPALDDVLDPAPDRGGPASLDAGPNPGPHDWPAWAGPVPLAGLVALRRLRRWQRTRLGPPAQAISRIRRST
jgi:hypothetical protein